MNTILTLISLICMSTFVLSVSDKAQRPNVVLIIADDLGWNDVSLHGSDQILTPNIDALAAAGVVLHQYRTHAQCTPSRAALLTGKFAHRLGMQGYPLTNGEDRGLPLSEKLLPQYLKELNYSTHLVGKWHVGHSRSAYLPNRRGFDNYLGHRGGYLDYYEYTSEEQWTDSKESGLDLYRNDTAAWDIEGYITDVYTSEAKKIISAHDSSRPLFLQLAHTAPHSGNDGCLLQAPSEDVRRMRHIESPERRVFGAMVKKLDDSIGEIIRSLYEKELLKNTIVIFISDNGGMTVGHSINYASNWPLRGLKMSPWEGGIRTVASIFTPTMEYSHHIWNGYFHVADWLPTILRGVGGDIPNDIDGFDMWNAIFENKPSPRKSVFEIDDYTGYAAIISHDYKLITGDVILENSMYYGDDLKGVIHPAPPYEVSMENSDAYNVFKDMGYDIDHHDIRNKLNINCNGTRANQCITTKDKFCLYNILQDPCEEDDLHDLFPALVNNMKKLLDAEMAKLVPRKVPLFRDPRAKPRLHNFTWTTWYEEVNSSNTLDV